MGCNTRNANPAEDYPHDVVDSLALPLTGIEAMGVSGGVLVVVGEDSAGGWSALFYGAGDLSEMGQLSLGHNNMAFGDLVMGPGEALVSLGSGTADTVYILKLDIVNQSVAEEFPLVEGGKWAPVALGDGVLFHQGDSADTLYGLDLSSGDVSRSPSDITPLKVGDILWIQGQGLFITEYSGHTLYLLDEAGALEKSWAVEDNPWVMAWDGTRIFLTTRKGLSMVSPELGTLSPIVLSGAGDLALSEDSLLVFVAYQDGVASVSTSTLELLGTARTPVAVNLVVAAGTKRALAARRGEAVIYVLE